MAKTSAQLDREIAAALGRRPSSSAPRRHHAAVATAAPHLEAVRDAIYRTEDPDALVAAVAAANKHVAAMKRIAKAEAKRKGIAGYFYGIDSSGEFDPAMSDLNNELVRANEMVRRIKIFKKTGRFPKPSSRTAWKLR